MSKKTEVRSIRLDDETQERLQRLSAKGLESADLIRLGLHFVLPMAEENPGLIKHLLIEI